MKRITNIICPAFALFALACFALSTANAAQPKAPNHPQVPIAFTANPGQCAPEEVKVSGVLQLDFEKEGQVVQVKGAKFLRFSGTGQKTGRKYVPTKVDVEKSKHANFQSGGGGVEGGGNFIVEFQVIGHPKPAGPAGQGDPCFGCTYHFTVNYKVAYTFKRNFKVQESVKELEKQLDKPKVCCNRNGCLP